MLYYPRCVYRQKEPEERKRKEQKIVSELYTRFSPLESESKIIENAVVFLDNSGKLDCICHTAASSSFIIDLSMNTKERPHDPF